MRKDTKSADRRPTPVEIHSQLCVAAGNSGPSFSCGNGGCGVRLDPRELALIDTHCHLDFESFDLDRDRVVQNAREAGISRIVVPSLDLNNCKVVLQLANQFTDVYAAVGVHPNSSEEWRDEWLDDIRELAGHPKVVAIGEIGLDYYRDRAPRNTQRRALKAQLNLAADLDLPVILHNRQNSN